MSAVCTVNSNSSRISADLVNSGVTMTQGTLGKGVHQKECSKWAIIAYLWARTNQLYNVYKWFGVEQWHITWSVLQFVHFTPENGTKLQQFIIETVETFKILAITHFQHCLGLLYTYQLNCYNSIATFRMDECRGVERYFWRVRGVPRSLYVMLWGKS